MRLSSVGSMIAVGALVVMTGCGSRAHESSVDGAPSGEGSRAHESSVDGAPSGDPSTATTSTSATAAASASASAAPPPTELALVPAAEGAPPTIRINMLTPRDPDRITPSAVQAILAIGASGASTPAGDHHDMSNMDGMNMEVPLTGQDAVDFAVQWREAQAAVPGFDTQEKAAALGYVRSATPENGIGTHWVSWEQIAKPFDPAHPAMLLFDERKPVAVLVGFAYWLQSPTPPVGFAGSNDDWHQHTNLCIVNGWLDREDADGHQDCAGTLFAGGDLWMLHAWVVPKYADRDGDFAVFNPKLCPSRIGTPDDLLCPA